MNMKTRMISLSILALLTLCLLNVAAASPTNPTAAPHSKTVPGVKAQYYTITFTAPIQVETYQHFDVSGRLTADGMGVSGAHIDIQRLTPSGWITFGNGYTTDSYGNYYGWASLYPPTGETYVRVVYDGVVGVSLLINIA